MSTQSGLAECPPERAREPAPDLTGRRLLHFLLVERAGRGGMGVVYRAFDEKLRRSVAVKLLSRARIASHDRRALLDEARRAASVVHPSIAAIHDVCEDGELAFLVMEYVEGQTLRERLARGPVPAEEARGIATRIAEALAAAHECNTVHRDLKPENVMLGTGGGVKILDFGVARPAAEPTRNVDDHDRVEPALSTRVRGTPAYMAPEQARGEVVDVRADVFAFGVLLLELLAGHLPFGESGARDAAARKRAVAEARRTAPADLVDVAARCLAHDPAKRWADGKALVRALARPPPAARRRRLLAWTAGVAFSLVLAGGAAILARPPSSGRRAKDAPRIVYDESPIMELPQGLAARRLAVSAASGMAAVWTSGGVFVQHLRGGDRRELSLPSDVCARAPGVLDFYPDGANLLVGGRGDYPWRVALETDEPPVRLPSRVSAGRLSPDATRMALEEQDGLHVAPLGGGDSRLIAPSEPSTSELLEMAWAPDGRALAASFLLVDGSCTVEVIFLESGRRASVEGPFQGQDRACAVAWVDAHHIAYVRDHHLLERRIDDGATASPPETVWTWSSGSVRSLEAIGGSFAYVRLDESWMLTSR